MLKPLGIFAGGDKTRMAKRLFDKFLLNRRGRVSYFDDANLTNVVANYPNIPSFCNALLHTPNLPTKIPVIVLSSMIMGLLLAPLGYIAIGALSGFSMAFSILSMPLLFGSIVFLLFQFLPKTLVQAANPRRSIVLEAVCWLLLGLFLLFVSGFTLLTTWERIGLFCVVLSAASVLVTPFMYLRPSALATRVAQWPAPILLVGSVSFAGLSIVCAVIYLLTPSRFL